MSASGVYVQLLIALHNNDLGSVTTLLRQLEARPDHRTVIDQQSSEYSGWTALTSASFKENLVAMDVLLRLGADIDAPTAFGANALMVAVAGGRIESVRMLLTRGSPLGRVDSTGNNALALAKAAQPRTDKHVFIEQLLLAAYKPKLLRPQPALPQQPTAPPVNVNGATNPSVPPRLRLALIQLLKIIDNAPTMTSPPQVSEFVLSVQRCLADGMTLDEVDERSGQSPLTAMARRGFDAAIKQLIDLERFDINVMTSSGQTALHVAIEHKHMGVCHVLLRHPDLDLTLKNAAGFTALICAVQLSATPIITMLLAHAKRRTFIQLADNEGRTALHHAAMAGDPYTTAILVGAGVDVHIRDKRELTALDCAVTLSNSAARQTVARLLSVNTEITSADSFVNNLVTRLLIVGASTASDHYWPIHPNPPADSADPSSALLLPLMTISEKVAVPGAAAAESVLVYLRAKWLIDGVTLSCIIEWCDDRGQSIMSSVPSHTLSSVEKQLSEWNESEKSSHSPPMHCAVANGIFFTMSLSAIQMTIPLLLTCIQQCLPAMNQRTLPKIGRLLQLMSVAPSEPTMDFTGMSDPSWWKSTTIRTLDVRTLELEPTIMGTGGMATVRKGTWHAVPIAYKEMKDQDGMTSDDLTRQEFYEEAIMLRDARCPNIVQLIGITLRPFGFVTEQLHQSLYDRIHSEMGRHQPRLTDLDRINIAVSVASALAVLHASEPSPIVHRDIKPHNILLSADLSAIKICDLGIARTVESIRRNTSYSLVGTWAWMAPESIYYATIPADTISVAAKEYMFQHMDKLDVYSFGIVMWEMITYQRPWYRCSEKEIAEKVQSGQRPDTHFTTDMTNFPEQWAAVIKWCVEPAPNKRPTMNELLIVLTSFRTTISSTPLLDAELIPGFPSLSATEPRLSSASTATTVNTPWSPSSSELLSPVSPFPSGFASPTSPLFAPSDDKAPPSAPMTTITRSKPIWYKMLRACNLIEKKAFK